MKVLVLFDLSQEEGNFLVENAGGDSELRVSNKRIICAATFETELGGIAAEATVLNLATLDQKQQDYGSLNLTRFGSKGVLVRLVDKIERLCNLDKKREKTNSLDQDLTNFESVNDTWLDAQNYALIGYVLNKGLWPTTKKD